jgi:hypothetical protein
MPMLNLTEHFRIIPDGAPPDQAITMPLQDMTGQYRTVLYRAVTEQNITLRNMTGLHCAVAKHHNAARNMTGLDLCSTL